MGLFRRGRTGRGSSGERLSDAVGERPDARAFLRVVDRRMMPAFDDRFRYARPIAEDLMEVVALDSPASARLLQDHDLVGRDLEELKAAGLENLVREPFDQVERLDDHKGAHFDVVWGDSIHTASKVLVLPDVLRRVYGERGFPHGLILAVPSWHQLVLHPIDDLDVVPSTQAMVAFAASGHADSSGAISPSVYWWRAGRLTRLSELVGDQIEITAGPEFAEMLHRLGARP